MSKSTDIFTTPKVTQHTFEKHHLSTSTHRDIQMQEQHPDSSNSTVAPLSGNANSGVSDSQAPVQAYAKLEGPDFCYYVRTLEVSLGRHSSSDDPDPVDIDLGDIKAVSRRHAKIHYNFMSQSFELQIFGKNGCLVDDEYFAKGQSVTLRHKMIIQIGDTEFSFLLPKAAMTAAGPANSVMPSSAGYSANTPGLAPAGPPAEPLGMHPGPHAPMAPLHTNDDSPQHQHPPQHGGYPVNAITPQRLNLYLQPEAAIRHQQQQRNPPGYPPNPMPLDDGRRDHRRRSPPLLPQSLHPPVAGMYGRNAPDDMRRNSQYPAHDPGHPRGHPGALLSRRPPPPQMHHVQQPMMSRGPPLPLPLPPNQAQRVSDNGQPQQPQPAMLHRHSQQQLQNQQPPSQQQKQQNQQNQNQHNRSGSPKLNTPSHSGKSIAIQPSCVPTSPSGVRILPATERPKPDDMTNTYAKPTYSYASLIAQAINATDDKKVTLNGIYTFIMDHYPYYQHAQNGWQNSIRHNLSLNKAFVRVQRASNEPGKGSYWAIEDSYKGQFSNGVYKRTRRTKKAMEMEREREKDRARARAQARGDPIGSMHHRRGSLSACTGTGASSPGRYVSESQSPITGGSSSVMGDKRMSPGDDYDDDEDEEDEDIMMDDDDDNEAAHRLHIRHASQVALSAGEDTVDYASSAQSNNGESKPNSFLETTQQQQQQKQQQPDTVSEQNLSRAQSVRRSASPLPQSSKERSPVRQLQKVQEQESPVRVTRSRTGSIGKQANAASILPPPPSRASQPRAQRSAAR